MKNRIRRLDRKDKPDIDALLKDIEEKQGKILFDLKDFSFTEKIGKVSVNAKGELDDNKIDLVDINNYHKFFDITHKGADFKEGDIDALIELMPSMIKCKNSIDSDQTIRPLDSAIMIAERLGSLPVDIYIAKHHAKTGNEKDNVNESLKLANILIDKILSISDEEIKAVTLTTLIDNLHYLDKIKERLNFKGFDFSYDEAGSYTAKERKEAEATFKRRNELPKDNPYRKDFVIQYINDEVYNRFYDGKDTVKYTAELGKEWDGHFNALCDEHKEPEYKRDFNEAYYKRLETNIITGEKRDDFLLCHYPLCCDDPFTHEKDLKEASRRYGIEPSIVSKSLALLDEHFKLVQFRYKETTP